MKKIISLGIFLFLCSPLYAGIGIERVIKDVDGDKLVIDSNGRVDVNVHVSTKNSLVEVWQDTHDDLNANANLQQGNTDVGTANPLEVNVSSSTDGIIIYPASGEVYPVSDNSSSLTVDAASTTFKVTIYDGGDVHSVDDGSSSLTVDASSTTHETTVHYGSGAFPVTDNSGTLTIADLRYESKISSVTANKIIVTGDITPTFEVNNWSFLSKGGDSTVRGSNINGTIYVLEDIAVNGNFPNPVDTPTFTATLPASTTLYYMISGVE